MDKKKEFFICVDYAKYVAVIAATICVLIFQFIAEPICITLALAFYVVAFALTFAVLVIRCVDLFKADAIVKEANANAEPSKEEEKSVEEQGIDGQNVEVVHLKKEKVWSIIGAVCCGLFTIFTFIVLILY